MNLLVVDLETTGLHPEKDQIIEFCAAEITMNGELCANIAARLIPTVPVHPKAAEVNGYPKGWENVITQEDGKKLFVDLFRSKELQLLGWNPGFDERFLRAHGWLDEVKVAYHPLDMLSMLWGVVRKMEPAPGRKYVSLEQAHRALVGGVESPKFHSAVGDVSAIIELYRWVIWGRGL